MYSSEVSHLSVPVPTKRRSKVEDRVVQTNHSRVTYGVCLGQGHVLVSSRLPSGTRPSRRHHFTLVWGRTSHNFSHTRTTPLTRSLGWKSTSIPSPFFFYSQTSRVRGMRKLTPVMFLRPDLRPQKPEKEFWWWLGVNTHPHHPPGTGGVGRVVRSTTIFNWVWQGWVRGQGIPTIGLPLSI